jgi:hypothetical protein
MTTKLDVDVSFIIPKVDDEKKTDGLEKRERLEDGGTLIWTWREYFAQSIQMVQNIQHVDVRIGRLESRQ